MSEFYSGFIAIVGRPNVGKSTLMNALIGEKIAIISDKPQTTRNRIQCILTRENYQIIFVDTPGIQKPKNKLGEYMIKAARNSLSDMEAILFVIDAAGGIGNGDREIAEWLKEINVPVILAANKMDIADKEKARYQINEFKEFGNFIEGVEISAVQQTNLKLLEQKLVACLPEGPKYYPDDMITDQPERVIISEIIREKGLELLREEVPHGIGVEIESIKEREDKNLVEIHASILCEKASHKGIVIGKGGHMLKSIGSRSRVDIERFLGVKVYLELFVKVKSDWRNDPNTLKTLGYDLREL
jgi:GTP-binding protein Era